MTGRTHCTVVVARYHQERNAFNNDPGRGILPLEYMPTPSVNVDTAHSVGAAILRSMEGKTSDEYTFRRKDQVVTLGTKSFIKLLFQRLIIVAQTSDELESAFKHELRSYPPALFDSSLLLREAHRLALADAIWVLLGPDVQADVTNKDSRYVLDGGGALIQRITWSRGSSYRCILKQCIECIAT